MGLRFPPPPGVGSVSINQTTNEMDDLREKLRIAEERAQQNYDEMKELPELVTTGGGRPRDIARE